MVVLVSVWLMLAWPAACALPPVIDPAGTITGATHVYSVPAGTISPPPLAGVTLKAVPLQIVAIVLAMVAFGFTVTVIVNVAPVHAPETGVTV